MTQTLLDPMACPAQIDYEPAAGPVFCGKARWHEGPHSTYVVAAERTVEWWFIGDEAREVDDAGNHRPLQGGAR